MIFSMIRGPRAALGTLIGQYFRVICVGRGLPGCAREALALGTLGTVGILQTLVGIKLAVKI